MACDAGIDCVLPLAGVTAADAHKVAYEAVFSRSPEDLASLALFIGGSSLPVAEATLEAIETAFFGSMRVSVMLDCGGCNTTAAAVVAKIRAVGELTGRRAVILAGTGPVGMRTAALMAREGAEVALTSRDLRRARAACEAVCARTGQRVWPAEVSSASMIHDVLEGAEVVVSAGAPGVSLLAEAEWTGSRTLHVLADVNAVPPLGIDGLDPTFAGERIGERRLFGALAIRRLKKQVHYACLSRLFERNDQVLDAEQIYLIARELESECAS